MRKALTSLILAIPIISFAATTNLFCTHSVANWSMDLIFDDSSSIVKYRSPYADAKNFLYATDIVVHDSTIMFNVSRLNEVDRMMLNRMDATMVMVGSEYRNRFTCQKVNAANKLF